MVFMKAFKCIWNKFSTKLTNVPSSLIEKSICIDVISQELPNHAQQHSLIH